jgi:hypothetical protein
MSVSKVTNANSGSNAAIISQEEMDDVLRKANFERQRKMQLQQINNELEAANNRARSVSVGTAFGGAVDLTMRRPDGVCTYAILQPVEAIEILHQLAAAVGCHLNLQPRQDFSSWRVWKSVEPQNPAFELENKQQASSPRPLPEYVQENRYKAREMPVAEEQPGLNPNTMELKNG